MYIFFDCDIFLYTGSISAKVRHRVLGAQLCGLFVEVESAKFENHLEEVLPVLQEQIDPDRYKQVSPSIPVCYITF